MTKKDYIVLARALATSRPLTAEGESKVEYEQWFRCAMAVVKELQQDNPRFDAGRFLAAAAGA